MSELITKYTQIEDTKTFLKAFNDNNLYVEVSGEYFKSGLLAESRFLIESIADTINIFNSGGFYYKEKFKKVESYNTLISAIMKNGLYKMIENEMVKSRFNWEMTNSYTLKDFVDALSGHTYYVKEDF